MKARRCLRRSRVAAALVGLAFVVATLVALAARVATHHPAFSVALGLALTVPVFSTWEWAMHRYVYHRVLLPSLRPAFLTHHRDHHFRFFPPSRFTRDEVMDGSPQAHPSVWARVASRTWGRRVSVPDRWVYLVFGVGVVGGGLGVLTRNPAFVAGIALAAAVIARLFGEVHGAIHHPGTRPRLERRAVFAWLRRHHYIHHVDTEANVNFLVPLADWAFGTLRLSMPERDQGIQLRRAPRGPEARGEGHRAQQEGDGD